MRKVFRMIPAFAGMTMYLVLINTPLWAAEKPREFKASGEVTSVDPLYSRVTISHGAIKDFSEQAETEFVVKSADMLKDLSRRDLVDFSVVDARGDVRIETIKKTGQAPPKDDKLKIGQAVQDVLEATGEVAKGVTTPIPPVHGVVSGAVGATTGATGSVLENVEGPEVKTSF